MNKRFLLVAALCAAMNVASFAQTNLAEGKTAVASTETTGEPASNAFDGNLESRWQVDATNKDIESVADEETDMSVTNGHWIYVDLGEEQDFNLIRIRWEGAYAKAFAIYTATELEETTQEPKWGEEAIYTKDETLTDFSKFYSYNIGDHKARYIKLQATELGFKGNWFSIYEMGVYKNDAVSTLTKVTTSTDLLRVGDTFTVSALDQLDQNMEDVEITATNAEKQTDGSFKATGEGEIVITVVANGVTLTKTIKAYVPKLTTTTVSPAIVVTGVDRVLNFTVKDQEGKDLVDYTSSLTGPTFKAEEDGPQTITITYGDETKEVTVYAISKNADVPTLSDEDDLSIYTDAIAGIGVSDPGWNGKYTFYEQLDINGNNALAVTNAGTFGIQQTAITETGFKSLNFDIFPTTATEGFVNFEGTGLANLTFKLTPGQWNHVSLDVTDGAKYNNWIQISMGKPGAYAPDNILIDNVYLSKKEATVAEGVYIEQTTDARNFYAITGYTKDAAKINALLTDKTATAYDLTNLNVEGSMTLTPANPNALILVKATLDGDKATLSDDWGETKNLVASTNGKSDGYLIPVNELIITDLYPVYNTFFISTKSTNGGYTYTRNLPAQTSVTVYLPKGTDIPAGCKVYELTADDTDANKIILKEATTINEKTPYIIYNGNTEEATLTVKGDGDLSFVKDNEKSVTVGNIIAHGTYSYFNGDGATQYGLQNETGSTLTLKKIGTGATVCPFRVYFTVADNSDENAAKISFTFEDEATGITDIKATDAAKATNIYSIDGKLVKSNATSTEGLAKGVYIINGKKYIVK